ncbi:heparinase II/III domain-containing protein [Corticicoccus populi]|uniref:Heparinase II/III family protein n=1 Tax=Corticicoccus populi TaxID=1812821 RepID=A0ABW5WXR8_9STAP
MKKNIFILLNKHRLNRSEIIKASEYILNDYMILKYNYIPKSFNSISDNLKFCSHPDWKIDMGPHTNMAMLHLHEWEPISYLLLAHYYTNEEKYLDKSIDLLEKWYKVSDQENHKYLWYRHCVADRSIVLSYLNLISSQKFKTDTRELIKTLTKTHKEFLANDKNFIEYNHGLMMDRSLLLLSIISKDEQNMNKAIERIKDNFLKTFTPNMICVENSITYFLFNLELIISIEKNIMEPMGLNILTNFNKKIEKSLDFLNIIKQPNNSFPLYGDGELVTIEKIKKSNIYEYFDNHLLFSNYTHHQLKGYYFENEGYITIKNKDSYFFLRCGDIVKNHKHADDLSFTLFHKEEILIDSGIYNYDRGDLKDYFKSPKSHNSIMLNDESYPYHKSTSHEIRIVYFNEENEYFHIILQNNAYEYANILRHIYILKDSFSIILSDHIISDFKIKNSLIFNFSKNISNIFNLKTNNNKIVINDSILLQTLDSNYINIHPKSSKKAKLSTHFHHLEYISQIEFVKFDSNAQLTSILSFDPDTTIPDTLEFSEDEIRIEDSNKSYTLKFINIENELVIGNYINVEFQGNQHLVRTYSNIFDECDYAWYIYIGDIREKIIWYQESPEFLYKFNQSGEYKIRCFVRNKRNKDEKREFTFKKYILHH